MNITSLVFGLILLVAINLAPITALAKECEILDKNGGIPPIDAILIDEAGDGKMVPYRHDFTNINPIEIHTSFEFPCQTDWPTWLSTRRFKTKGSGFITDEIAQSGKQSLKVTLSPGAYVSNGWRAEIRDLNNAKKNLGSVVPDQHPYTCHARW